MHTIARARCSRLLVLLVSSLCTEVVKDLTTMKRQCVPFPARRLILGFPSVSCTRIDDILLILATLRRRRIQRL